MRLAGENVATKKAAVEKDEAVAEAAKEMYADSSAESSVFITGYKAKAAVEKDIEEAKLKAEADAEAAEKMYANLSDLSKAS